MLNKTNGSSIPSLKALFGAIFIILGVMVLALIFCYLMFGEDCFFATGSIIMVTIAFFGIFVWAKVLRTYEKLPELHITNRMKNILRCSIVMYIVMLIVFIANFLKYI